MRTKTFAIGAIAFLVLLLIAPGLTMAQLQVNGGGSAGGASASVGTTGAAAPASASLTGGTFNTAPPTLTNGQMGALQLDAAGNLKVAALPTGANVIGAISNTGFAVNAALPAGTNVIGTVNTIPKTACGNAVFSQALSAVPTVSTAVAATTSCVVAIILNNPTAGTISVSVSDNAGSPVNALLSFDIPAKSQLIQPLFGVAYTSGIKWNASGAGVTGAILAYQ